MQNLFILLLTLAIFIIAKLNFMASNLFSFGDVRNHPHRSGFDLSRRICFTSKAGELLPVYYKLVYPGDKFQIRHQLFTRTQPVNTAAYTRIREYLDWYFVPLRLINKNLPQALMNMQNNPVQASGISANKIVTNDIPWTILGNDGAGKGVRGLASFLQYMYEGAYDKKIPPVLNFFGFNAGTCGTKLAMMLRYGNFISPSYTGTSKSFGLSPSPDFSLFAYNTNYSVNVIPFAAYQKIYADHFRFSQWEKNEPYTYNFDWYSGGNVFASFDSGYSDSLKEYVSGNNLFTLRYANWPKDLFMGVMPNSQLGDVSVVDVLPTSSDSPNLIGDVVGVTTGNVNATGLIAMNGTTEPGVFNMRPARTPDTNTVLRAVISNPSLQASFSVLQLRMAEAVQRYREVSQVADQTARDQIYAHFGVSLSPALSDTCFRIGGSASNIDISEVVNTFLGPDTETEANIKGKGVGTGQGGTSFSSDEYGVLMAIYHVVPLLDYVITGQPQDLLYTNTADLPFPEFDSIGMQSLHFGRFFNYKTSAFASDPTGSVMGYTPRFIDLKTDYDEVYGAFRSTLKSWVAPLDPDYLSKWVSSTILPGESTPVYSLNYGFFKVNPSVLDSIFKVKADSSMDSDQFLSSLYLDVKAVRNFDYDGMPY